MMETLQTSVLKFKNVAWNCLSLSLIGQMCQKCRQLVSELGVHSLHVSSRKQSRRFIRNLLQWRWTFL